MVAAETRAMQKALMIEAVCWNKTSPTPPRSIGRPLLVFSNHFFCVGCKRLVHKAKCLQLQAACLPIHAVHYVWAWVPMQTIGRMARTQSSVCNKKQVCSFASHLGVAGSDNYDHEFRLMHRVAVDGKEGDIPLETWARIVCALR